MWFVERVVVRMCGLRLCACWQRSSQVNLVAAIDIMQEYLSKDRFAALRDSYGIRDYKKEVVSEHYIHTCNLLLAAK